MHLARLSALTVFPWLSAQAPLVPAPLTEAGESFRVSAALGDVDQDGIDDLVIGANGALRVRKGLAGPPERRFAAEQTLPHSVEPSCENTGQPRLFDFDRDGDIDLLVIDSPLSTGRGRLVWFANDGSGAFAAAQIVNTEDGRPLVLDDTASAFDFMDWDGDGAVDLMLSRRRDLWLFRGSARGFAATPADLGIAAMTVAAGDWDGDGRPDAITVEDRQITVRVLTKGGPREPQSLAHVEGDVGQARLALADWNGDGRIDVLLGENRKEPRAVPPPDPGRDEDVAARIRVARRIVEVADEEIRKINATRPPLDDAAAMARRNQLRDDIAAWAAPAKAELKQLQPVRPSAETVRSSMRVLMQP